MHEFFSDNSWADEPWSEILTASKKKNVYRYWSLTDENYNSKKVNEFDAGQLQSRRLENRKILSTGSKWTVQNLRGGKIHPVVVSFRLKFFFFLKTQNQMITLINRFPPLHAQLNIRKKMWRSKENFKSYTFPYDGPRAARTVQNREPGKSRRRYT